MKHRTVFSGNQMQRFAVLAGIFCITMASNVPAQQNSNPCAEDTARLCKGVQQGEGRILQCIKEHANELSPACKQNIAAAKEKVQDFTQACKDDMQARCSGIKPGGGRILQCLKQHEAELSPGCKEKMEQAKGKK